MSGIQEKKHLSAYLVLTIPNCHHVQIRYPHTVSMFTHGSLSNLNCDDNILITLFLLPAWCTDPRGWRPMSGWPRQCSVIIPFPEAETVLPCQHQGERVVMTWLLWPWNIMTHHVMLAWSLFIILFTLNFYAGQTFIISSICKNVSCSWLQEVVPKTWASIRPIDIWATEWSVMPAAEMCCYNNL